jgi:hypothetical protein
MGYIEYNLVQISKDSDRANAQWPFQASDAEVLNQPLLPFTKRIFRKLCLNCFSTFPTPESFQVIRWLWFALDARAVLASYIRI